MIDYDKIIYFYQLEFDNKVHIEKLSARLNTGLKLCVFEDKTFPSISIEYLNRLDYGSIPMFADELSESMFEHYKKLLITFYENRIEEYKKCREKLKKEINISSVYEYLIEESKKAIPIIRGLNYETSVIFN